MPQGVGVQVSPRPPMRRIERIEDRSTRDLLDPAEFGIEDDGSAADINCTEFAFRVVRGEVWNMDEARRFDKEPQAWLEERGYREVDEPTAGDLVLYFIEPEKEVLIARARRRPGSDPVVKHVGIIHGDGRVLSKIKQNPPQLRALTDPLFTHGTLVSFFRKPPVPPGRIELPSRP